jgi:hypothetical protein
MKYVRAYADQDGESHAEEVELGMTSTNFAPPAPPVDMSPLMPSTHVAFLSARPPGDMARRTMRHDASSSSSSRASLKA